jgi:hypothetical protein
MARVLFQIGWAALTKPHAALGREGGRRLRGGRELGGHEGHGEHEGRDRSRGGHRDDD